MYYKLVAKVNIIDISGFFSKTKFAQINQNYRRKFLILAELEKKIPNTRRLVKKTDYNVKITEIENKIASISSLATNGALASGENKIPDISSLVTERDYNAKINKIEKKLTDHNHDKYITTPEFNKFTAEIFAARLLAQANLVTTTNFDTKLKSLDQKIKSNKTKYLFVENELKNCKHMIQFILEVKVILKKMVLKII